MVDILDTKLINSSKIEDEENLINSHKQISIY